MPSMHCLFDYEFVAGWTAERLVLCHRHFVPFRLSCSHGRAAGWLRAGGAAAARRGQVRPAHRHVLVAPARSKARDPRPGQARRHRPHRDRHGPGNWALVP